MNETADMRLPVAAPSGFLGVDKTSGSGRRWAAVSRERWPDRDASRPHVGDDREAMRGAPPLTHVAVADAPEVLAAILVPHVTLAVWRRAVPGAVAAALGLLDLEAIDDLRFDAALDGLTATLADAMKVAGYPAEAAAIAEDVATLAAQFGATMARGRVDLRLEVIDSNACHKFHSDHVTARLISTYAGPGTQWLDQADAAAHAAGAPPDALAVRVLNAGEVAMFKGRVWAPERPIIHRSPPIAGTGVRRLVLTINPGEDGVVHV